MVPTSRCGGSSSRMRDRSNPANRSLRGSPDGSLTFGWFHLHFSESRRIPLLLLLFFFLLSSVLRDGLLVEALVNDEGQALLTFRDGLTSDPFGVLANWNINDPNPCLWTGVYCSQELNVTKLILDGGQLQGVISKELSRLTSLRTLALGNNNISGAIPPEIGHLSTLYKLNLSKNALTGGVPEELVWLNRLRMFDLSDNMLAGSLPPGLVGANCTKLRYVNLAGNKLTGPFPASLGLCSNLEGISLASNRIGGRIPSSIGRLTMLQFASLEDNILSGTIPDELGFCSSLVDLDISRNQLQGSLPVTIANLKSLQFFDASQNMLSGSILPEVVFQSSMRYLNLSHNSFSGVLPVFPYGNCSTLAIYDLSYNNLRGEMPQDFGLCTPAIYPSGLSPIRTGTGKVGSLQSSILDLDLSRNNLTGMLALFSIFTEIRSLDLSDNRLSAMLPVAISEWLNLNRLDLSNNDFYGRIPDVWTSLSKLRDFNVSYNDLSGPIPRRGAFSSLGPSSFLGNVDLCGSPLNTPCPSGPSTAPQSGRTKTRVLSTSAVIAISVAGTVALCVVVITAMNLRITRKMDKTELLVYESSPPSPDETSLILGKLVLFGKHIPDHYEDWETGTKKLLDNDFLIGSGSIGTVYKANFDGGKSIAVKKLSTLGRIRNQEEFEHEMGMLGNLRHPNLIPLHGYYWSSSMQLLLSEYIPNGNLHQHLHEIGDEFHLDWPRRFHIALGTARALAFLHHDCKPRILHFDVKSSNILLDENFEPYLGDYGLTKLLPMMNVYVTSRQFQSAIGYVAPELACQSLRLTDKCDVYSYGVVLLELVTSQQPVIEQPGEEVVILCDQVRAALEKGRVLRCLDPELMRRNPESEIMQVLKLALFCTAQLPGKRPTMAEVVLVLESIRTSAVSSPAN